MTILKLDLGLADGRRQYTLDIVLSGSGSIQLPEDVVFEYTASTVLHTRKSQVFNGNIKHRGNDFGHQVVCKVAEKGAISGLKKEAELYTTVLRDLWGSHVPYFLCYSTGVSAYTKKPIACLLTRYCGEPPRGSDWFEVSPETRLKAFNALVKLHLRGICHNDFTPRNTVLNNTGKLVIIDFNRAHAGHPCQVLDREYELYEDEPSRCDLNCGEVYETSLNMDIWTPLVYPFKELPIPMSSISSAEDIVKIALDRLPAARIDILRREAEQVFSHYRNFYLARQNAAKGYRENSPLPAIGSLVSQLEHSSLAENPGATV